MNLTEKWVLRVTAEELLSQVRGKSSQEQDRGEAQRSSVLLTCEHPQSEAVEEVEKSEVENTDMDATGEDSPVCFGLLFISSDRKHSFSLTW